MSVAGDARRQALPRVLAIFAVAFGIATLVAGGRVLSGADPGYAVYRPLLLFNTAMGAAYLAAGLFAWRDLRRGLWAFGGIALVNAVVLLLVAWLATAGGTVARQSVGAMAFRTAVWVLLWAALALWRRAGRTGPRGV